MTTRIDNILNRVTMYRLVLYYLIFLVMAAVALSFFGFLPFQPLDLLVSTSVLVFVCWAANAAFARVFGVPANTESLFITAFILALIITPLPPSRYLAAGSGVRRLGRGMGNGVEIHPRDPPKACLQSRGDRGGAHRIHVEFRRRAGGWERLAMMPFVLVGGLLVARKIARVDLVVGFLAAACAVILGAGLAKGAGVVPATVQLFADTPILFFAFVMLTEPLTTPPSRKRRIVYGAMVGLLFAPFLHFGRLYLTPELALLLGNVLSYLLSPKTKYLLRLKTRTPLAPDIYELRFASDRRVRFQPGQYLEWTLGHSRPDSRGNRRVLHGGVLERPRTRNCGRVSSSTPLRAVSSARFSRCGREMRLRPRNPPVNSCCRRTDGRSSSSWPAVSASRRSEA